MRLARPTIALPESEAGAQKQASSRLSLDENRAQTARIAKVAGQENGMTCGTRTRES
jgi:hypothetical protein